jgi:hypothetical protein
VSTFGNTGKHRPGPGPDSDRATGGISHVPLFSLHQKKHHYSAF